MADRADRAGFEDLLRTAIDPDPHADAARARFATSRIHALEHVEQRLLDLAVHASDDTEARWLELWADAAWRDAQALQAEHDTESGSHPD